MVMDEGDVDIFATATSRRVGDCLSKRQPEVDAEEIDFQGAVLVLSS